MYRIKSRRERGKFWKVQNILFEIYILLELLTSKTNKKLDWLCYRSSSVRFLLYCTLWEKKRDSEKKFVNILCCTYITTQRLNYYSIWHLIFIFLVCFSRHSPASKWIPRIVLGICLGHVTWRRKPWCEVRTTEIHFYPGRHKYFLDFSSSDCDHFRAQCVFV